MSPEKSAEPANDIEGGDVQIAPARKGLDLQDKVLLGGVLFCFCLLAGLLMLGVHWVLATFFGMFDAADGGVGWRSAFLAGSGISFCTMLLFALVAGEGVVGELTAMIVGFFAMCIFFTVSIAFVF